MTRRSRRELESALDDLGDASDDDAPERCADCGKVIDPGAAAGVTADFVRFDGCSCDETLPEGAGVNTSVGYDDPDPDEPEDMADELF